MRFRVTGPDDGAMSVGAAEQVGWLLRVNRRLGPDAELRNGRRFTTAFGGRRAPSHISRWESGRLLVDRATVRRYEHLLGLTPESLVTVRDAIYRTLPPGVHPPADPPPDTDDRLHDLLDLARSGDAMTGAEWGELTELIAGRRDLVLHPRELWSRIARRLLTELSSSEGTAWLERQEAACRLLEHPASRAAMVATCIALVDDPGTAAVIEPLTLLDTVADPVANAYVLRELESPRDDRRYRGALMAAIRKIQHGHFGDDDRTRIARFVGTSLAGSAEGETRALLDRVRASFVRPEPADRPTAGGRGQRLAMDAMGAVGDDQPAPVLSSLIGQALGEHSGEQRVVAAMAIAQSPYREPVSAALAGDVRRSVARRTGDDLSPALQALTILGTDLHRPTLFDLLTGPGHPTAARVAAAWALPHCAGRFTVRQWQRILDFQLAAWRQRRTAPAESALRAVAYGIGTDGHHALMTRIEADPELPPAVRSTVTWLRDSRQPDQR
jgi:hypothetical protein